MRLLACETCKAYLLVVDLERVPDVAAVETRISGYALLDTPQIVEPASARLVSLPLDGRPRINDLAMVRGRSPDPAKAEEAVVSEIEQVSQTA